MNDLNGVIKWPLSGNLREPISSWVDIAPAMVEVEMVALRPDGLGEMEVRDEGSENVNTDVENDIDVEVDCGSYEFLADVR